MQVAHLLTLKANGWRTPDLAVKFKVSERTVQRRLRLPDERKKPKLKPHGTEAGYCRHRRAKEPPCDACLTGHAEYNLNRKAQRGDDQADSGRMGTVQGVRTTPASVG